MGGRRALGSGQGQRVGVAVTAAGLLHVALEEGGPSSDATPQPMTTWTALSNLPASRQMHTAHFPVAQAAFASPHSPRQLKDTPGPACVPGHGEPPGKAAVGTGAHLPSAIRAAGSFKQEFLQDTALDSRQDPAGTTLQRRARVSASRKCPGQSRHSCRTSSAHR